MRGRKKELWKNYASVELVDAVERCGYRSGPYFTRCRKIACRSCRLGRLWNWHNADAAWLATMSGLWHVVGRAQIGNISEIGTAIGREKSRLRSMIARADARISARGFAVIEPSSDGQPIMVIHALIGNDVMSAGMLMNRMERLWPGTRIDRYGGDLVEVMRPMVQPVGADPALRAAYYEATTFRQVRIVFGGERVVRGVREQRDPMAMTL